MAFTFSDNEKSVIASLIVYFVHPLKSMPGWQWAHNSNEVKAIMVHGGAARDNNCEQVVVSLWWLVVVGHVLSNRTLARWSQPLRAMALIRGSVNVPPTPLLLPVLAAAGRDSESFREQERDEMGHRSYFGSLGKWWRERVEKSWTSSAERKFPLHAHGWLPYMCNSPL